VLFDARKSAWLIQRWRRSRITDLKTAKHSSAHDRGARRSDDGEHRKRQRQGRRRQGCIRAAYGVDLPATPERVTGNGIAFIWHGPDQWMAIADRGAGPRDLEVE
jgi:sarcosine oxidase gamma subunit